VQCTIVTRAGRLRKSSKKATALEPCRRRGVPQLRPSHVPVRLTFRCVSEENQNSPTAWLRASDSNFDAHHDRGWAGLGANQLGFASLAFSTELQPVGGSFLNLLSHFRGKAVRGRAADGLWQLIVSFRITILRGSSRLAEETGSSPAPKEQPPRKLSGNKDRKTYRHSGKRPDCSGPPKRKRHSMTRAFRGRVLNLSGSMTEGAL